MSKLTIVLCVFFASAANSKWSVTMKAELEAFQETLNATVLNFQEKHSVTRQHNHEIAKNMSETAAKFSLNAADEVFSSTQKVGAEISKLADNSKDVNISECLQYPNHLNSTARPVIFNMSACFAKQLRTGLDQIVSINELFEDEFSRLETLRNSTQSCTDNLDGAVSAFGAVLCIRAALLNVTESGNFNTELSAKIARLNFSFETFEPLLASCKTTHGLANLLEEAATVVEKTEKCIQQKKIGTVNHE